MSDTVCTVMGGPASANQSSMIVGRRPALVSTCYEGIPWAARGWRMLDAMEGTEFDERAFFRRIGESGAPDAALAIPCIADLLATKRFGRRPKDLEDIRLLLALRDEGGRT